MTAVGARVDGWLFGAETGRRLRIIEAGLTVFLLVRLTTRPFRDLAAQPDVLFRPPSTLWWLGSMPSVGVITALQVVGVVGALLALARRWPRAAFGVAWLSLVALDGLLASRGKVMHNDLLPLLVCVPFLIAPSDARLVDRDPSPRYGFPIRTALVVVAGAYFWAGLAKVISSGPAWVLTDNMRYILWAGAATDRPPTDAVALFVANRDLLAHLSAAFVLGLELTFVAILFWPRSRAAFAFAAVAVHTGTYLTLGLDYWAWAAIVPLVLIDWDRMSLGPAWRSKSPTPSSAVR